MDPCKPKYLDKESFMCCFVTYFDIWLVVSNILYFHPYLGKIPILTNIFQRG